MIIHRDVNTVLRIEIGDQTCALRIPRLSESLLQIDRHSECAITRAAARADLAPEVLVCEPEAGVLITRWIDERPWTAEEARTEERIKDVARALGKLHQLPIPPGARILDLGAHLDAYWRSVTSQADVPDKLRELRGRAEALISERQYRPCLCHNDLHARNILGTGDRMRFLDWEYAGVGHPFYDLASFVRSNDLTGSQQAILLDGYGGFDPAEREQFEHECWLFDWTCALWMVVSGQYRTPSGRAAFDQLIERLTT